MNTSTANMNNLELESTILTPPVCLEDFHNDVTNVFLHHIRNISWMVDAKTAWSITKAPSPESYQDLYDPEYMAEHLPLKYEHIQQTEFARAMQRMYDYAYFGQLDLSQPPIEYESIHTWITALVVDLATSTVGNEWDSYGLDILSCASRCAQIAETANARLILEGEAPFFYYFKGKGVSRDDSPEEGVLTVRQVSLLAGMEEMSIRAAANPNRPNQLRPTKTDNGTRFEIQVVKEWLLSKKRYVPIKKRWFAREMDLYKRRFSSLSEIHIGIDDHYEMLCSEHGRNGIDSQIKALGLSFANRFSDEIIKIEKYDFSNEKKMRELAKILKLPEDIFVLRIKEVLATENLREIGREIKELGGK